MDRLPTSEIELPLLDPKGAQVSVDKNAIILGETYDTSSTTRILCLCALVTSWIVGLVCLALGSSILSISARNSKDQSDAKYDPNRGDLVDHRWPVFHASPIIAELLPLLLNFIMTILLDGLGYIHATTLRWALDDRLEFSANLRLFTAPQSYYALSWPTNLLFAGLLTLSYTSTSLLFVNQPSQAFCDLHPGLGYAIQLGCGDDVHIATPALIALGVALLGQAALATWQLFAVAVPTWSSNPLDTAWAMMLRGSRSRVPGRCMMSVHDAKLPPQPQIPLSRQHSIWTAHRDAKKILLYVWLVAGLSTVFFITIVAVIAANVARLHGTPCNECGTYPGPNWDLLPDTHNSPTSAAIISEQSAAMFAGLFLVLLLVTGLVTMALHCVELITNLFRDELTWRACATSNPYTARQNAFIRAGTSWSALLLFLLKVILHWLVGNGIKYTYNWGLLLRPPQLLYLALGMTLLAVFGTFICWQKLKGPQPAAFGHVQTVVDLVDEWFYLLFWGDKGETDRVRHAGTATTALAAVVPGQLYAR